MFNKTIKSIVFAWLTLFNITCVAQVLPINRYYNPDYMGGRIWDNTINNGVVDNGNGTWNTTTANWLSVPNGINQNWVAGSSAIFGGNLGNGVAGTVSVSGNQNVKSLTFQPTPTGNFTIQNGTLQLSGGYITTNQNATVSSVLQGGGNFIKSGLSNITLTGNNTFTGSIMVSQGGLYLGSSTAAGSTAILLGDDNTGSGNIEWRWGGGFTPNNNITVNNKGTGTVTLGAYYVGTYTEHTGNIQLNRSVIFFDNSNDRSTFTGVISGNPGTIIIDGNGIWDPTIGQIARVTFTNSSNSFIGSIIVNAQKAFQIGQGTTVNNQPITVNGSLVLNAGQNNTAGIGALSGAAAAICEIHVIVTGPQTLSIGNDNGTATYNGIVRNGLGGQVMNLLKAGTGTEILTGTSTYTGTTIINGGVLGGTGTLANTSSTAVNTAGKIQGGTGTGNAGIFAVRNLVFSGNAALDVYSNGTILSRVQVTGTCNLGTVTKINLLQTMPAGIYNIISSSAAMSGTLPTIGTNSSGRTATLSRTGNNLVLTLT